MNDVHLHPSGRTLSEAIRGMEGLVFCEPFHEMLRRLSASYLADVWTGVDGCLRRSGIDPASFTWGGGHPAYTVLARHWAEDSPLEYFGWVTPADRRAGTAQLWETDRPYELTALGNDLEQRLRQGALPVTVAGADIRATRFGRVVAGVDIVPIEPDDPQAGLELLIQRCRDDGAGWAPTGSCAWLKGDHPCGAAARSIAVREPDGYVEALETARRAYTPEAHAMVERAFAALVLGWLRDDAPGHESVVPAPAVVALDDEASVEFSVDPRRRPGWASIMVRTEGVAGRPEPVHVSQLQPFEAALEAAAAGTTPARLWSLGRRMEITCEARCVGIRGVRTLADDGADLRIDAIVEAGILGELRSAVREVLTGLGP